MLYGLTKLAWTVLQPSSLLVVTTLAGLALMRWRPRAKLGARLAWGGAVGLAIAGFSPLANLVVLPLEQRFVPTADAGEIAAIISLGGAEDGRVGGARGQLALNEAAERITEVIVLARRYPQARVVFSGGAAGVVREERPAGGQIAEFWKAAGIAPERILFEERSRTTHENALECLKLLAPKPGARYLLVTSAAHMPRSVGTFRQAGFTVAAHPVDFRTSGAGDVLRTFDNPTNGLRRLDEAVREWLGLAVYRLTGRSDALYPAP